MEDKDYQHVLSLKGQKRFHTEVLDDLSMADEDSIQATFDELDLINFLRQNASVLPKSATSIRGSGFNAGRSEAKDENYASANNYFTDLPWVDNYNTQQPSLNIYDQRFNPRSPESIKDLPGDPDPRKRNNSQNVNRWKERGNQAPANDMAWHRSGSRDNINRSVMDTPVDQNKYFSNEYNSNSLNPAMRRSGAENSFFNDTRRNDLFGARDRSDSYNLQKNEYSSNLNSSNKEPRGSNFNAATNNQSVTNSSLNR
jgi:hypothetical protein